MDLARFEKLPILGIVRGVEEPLIEPLVDAAASAGLQAIEITMNTKDAAALIKKAVKSCGKRISIGAGTVVDEKSLKAALDAGATFIVTPVLVDEVVAHCVKNKIPVFPGALTPLEIYNAWKAGATMVKVFPSGFLGPEYFTEIKGPFNDIKLLACGGVTPQNIKTYLESGANAVAFGASVFRKEWLAKKDFASVSRRIKEYISAI